MGAHRVRGSRMSGAADRRAREAGLGVDAAEAAARIAALENLVAQYRVLLETSAAITASTDLVETLETHHAPRH